jgi:hypothetical protein
MDSHKAQTTTAEVRMNDIRERNWTDVEVQEAISAIKKQPGLWEELEQIERTTGEFRNTEASTKELRVLARLHPECTLHEITQLNMAIRICRRVRLGLE